MFDPLPPPPQPLQKGRLNRSASVVTVDSEAALPGDFTVGSYEDDSDTEDAEDDAEEGEDEEEGEEGATAGDGDGGGLDGGHGAQEVAVVGALRRFAAECGAAGLFSVGEQAALATLLGDGEPTRFCCFGLTLTLSTHVR
jgi:hypothetical protein